MIATLLLLNSLVYNMALLQWTVVPLNQVLSPATNKGVLLHDNRLIVVDSKGTHVLPKETLIEDVLFSDTLTLNSVPYPPVVPGFDHSGAVIRQTDAVVHGGVSTITHQTQSILTSLSSSSGDTKCCDGWTWTTEEFVGDPSRFPSARDGHTLVWYGGVILYGGKYTPVPKVTQPTYFSDMWKLTQTGTPQTNATWDWTPVPVVEGTAKQLAGHSAVEFRDVLWVFGGTQPSGLSNSLLAFHFISSSWRTVHPKAGSSQPVPRTAHSAVTYHQLMLVYGGVSLSGHVDDLWAWNMVSPEQEWKVIVPTNAPPQPSTASKYEPRLSLVVHHNRLLYMHTDPHITPTQGYGLWVLHHLPLIDEESWTHIGSVCIGGRDGTLDNTFSVPHSGVVQMLKLEHLNGTIDCTSSILLPKHAGKHRWGCLPDTVSLNVVADKSSLKDADLNVLPNHDLLTVPQFWIIHNNVGIIGSSVTVPIDNLYVYPNDMFYIDFVDYLLTFGKVCPKIQLQFSDVSSTNFNDITPHSASCGKRIDFTSGREGTLTHVKVTLQPTTANEFQCVSDINGVDTSDLEYVLLGCHRLPHQTPVLNFIVAKTDSRVRLVPPRKHEETFEAPIQYTFITYSSRSWLTPSTNIEGAASISINVDISVSADANLQLQIGNNFTNRGNAKACYDIHLSYKKSMCGIPTLPSHSGINPYKPYFQFGESILLTCIDGYDVNQGINNSHQHFVQSDPDTYLLRTTCTDVGDNGVWDPNINLIPNIHHYCVPPEGCKSPTFFFKHIRFDILSEGAVAPLHTNLVKGLDGLHRYPPGTTARFYCPGHLYFTGEPIAVCQKHGAYFIWATSGNPQCVCPPPPQPTNGNTDERQAYHRLNITATQTDYVTYTCNYGLDMHGVDYNVCDMTGTWLFSPPTCHQRSITASAALDRTLEAALGVGSILSSGGTLGAVQTLSAISMLCMKDKPASTVLALRYFADVQVGIGRHPEETNAFIMVIVFIVITLAHLSLTIPLKAIRKTQSWWNAVACARWPNVEYFLAEFLFPGMAYSSSFVVFGTDSSKYHSTTGARVTAAVVMIAVLIYPIYALSMSHRLVTKYFYHHNITETPAGFDYPDYLIPFRRLRWFLPKSYWHGSDPQYHMHSRLLSYSNYKTKAYYYYPIYTLFVIVSAIIPNLPGSCTAHAATMMILCLAMWLTTAIWKPYRANVVWLLITAVQGLLVSIAVFQFMQKGLDRPQSRYTIHNLHLLLAILSTVGAFVTTFCTIFTVYVRRKMYLYDAWVLHWYSENGWIDDDGNWADSSEQQDYDEMQSYWYDDAYEYENAAYEQDWHESD